MNDSADLQQATAFSKTFGGVLVRAAAHGIAQGTLAMMQSGGAGFLSGAAAGFFGSLGATAWGGAGGKWQGIGGKYAGSAVGTIAFGALSGGVGASLTGGNFWQGAVTGGIVAGLNDVMHNTGNKKIDPKLPNPKTRVNGSTYKGKDGNLYQMNNKHWVKLSGVLVDPSFQGGEGTIDSAIVKDNVIELLKGTFSIEQLKGLSLGGLVEFLKTGSVPKYTTLGTVVTGIYNFYNEGFNLIEDNITHDEYVKANRNKN